MNWLPLQNILNSEIKSIIFSAPFLVMGIYMIRNPDSADFIFKNDGEAKVAGYLFVAIAIAVLLYALVLRQTSV